MAIIFPMPGSDTKNLTEVEKWKIYAEVCKWTDQKTGKIVNNGIERLKNLQTDICKFVMTKK